VQASLEVAGGTPDALGTLARSEEQAASAKYDRGQIGPDNRVHGTSN